jgi:2'-5' RNA ligase
METLMVTRAVVAFPQIERGEVIQRLRERYDPLAASIAPHLTLVFPFESALTTDELAEHVSKAVVGFEPFRVRLQGITGQEGEYLFLNVKRGNDQLIELHDRLYNGPLAPFLRPEFTYTPHLTVGRLPDSDTFRAALDDARQITMAFEATIAEITLYRIEPGLARPVEHVTRL